MALSLGFPRVGATDHPCPSVSGLSSKAYLLDREAGEAAPPRLPGLRLSILAGGLERFDSSAAAGNPTTRHRPRRHQRRCARGRRSRRPRAPRRARTAPSPAPSRRDVGEQRRHTAVLGLRHGVQRRPRGGHEQQSEAEAERHQQRQRPEAVERDARNREHAERRAPPARNPARPSAPRRASPSGARRPGPPRPPRARSA